MWLFLQCQSAALDELFGKGGECFQRYHTAQILLHSLAQHVSHSQDRALLIKCMFCLRTDWSLLNRKEMCTFLKWFWKIWKKYRQWKMKKISSQLSYDLYNLFLNLHLRFYFDMEMHLHINLINIYLISYQYQFNKLSITAIYTLINNKSIKFLSFAHV